MNIVELNTCLFVIQAKKDERSRFDFILLLKIIVLAKIIRFDNLILVKNWFHISFYCVKHLKNPFTSLFCFPKNDGDNWFVVEKLLIFLNIWDTLKLF